MLKYETKLIEAEEALEAEERRKKANGDVGKDDVDDANRPPPITNAWNAEDM